MDNKHKKNMMKKAYKNGHSPLDVARMQAIARAEAKRMEAEASEIAFIDMLAIPCAVLAFDYWPKSATRVCQRSR